MSKRFLEKLPSRFKNDIEKAIELLKNEGCTEIFIFGSLAAGNYNDQSDIDIAVKGLQLSKFYEVGGKLLFLLDNNFDLIRLDDEQSNFAKLVKKNQVLIRVA